MIMKSVMLRVLKNQMQNNFGYDIISLAQEKTLNLREEDFQ